MSTERLPRVLHVIGPMEVGGAQTQLLGLVRAAHGRLWDATVCSTAPGDMLAAFRVLGVPMIELRRVASPGLGRIVRLRSFVGRGRFDVVHGVLPHGIVYAQLAVAGRRRARRPAVVAAERDVEPRRRPMLVAHRVLSRWTDRWVANSTAVADAVRAWYAVPDGALEIVPNAVDRAVFRPATSMPSGTVVGFVGRLGEEKGADVFVRAARTVLAKRPDVEVVVAGTGPLEPQLRATADGAAIRFTGSLEPGAAVAALLRDLTVLVVPSRREGMPNVVLEALAVGVPIVASDLPAVREALAGAPARLVPPGDAVALAAATIEALDDGGRRADVAGSVLGFDELAARYRTAFDRAVASRERR